MQPALRHKSSDQMLHSSINSNVGSTKNPIGKSSSRPSSGVGVLLLDVIGSDVKVCIFSNWFVALLISHYSLTQSRTTSLLNLRNCILST